MRAAVYVRRSRDEHQHASLEVQLEEAERFIKKNGWRLAQEHVFSDDSISRAEFQKRPALIALLNAAEARAFDVVVVRDETRLGGDIVRTTLLIQDLLDAGVRLFYYFTKEEVRLDDATAKFMIAARNFAGELEREKIAQRTHEHLLTKARRGLNVGGRCYGYNNVDVMEGDKRIRVEYTINEAEAKVVREIFNSYAKGMGLKALAKDLNRRGIPSPRAGKRGTGSWDPSSIRAMLRRSRYVGRIEWNRHEKTYRKGTKVRVQRPKDEIIHVEAPHLRIVDDETWVKVQARIAQHKRGQIPKRGRPARYLLSGIARCHKCGGPLKVINGKDGQRIIKVYVCSRHRQRGNCDNTARRPVETVNAAVLDWILANILSEDLALDVLKEIRTRLAHRARTTTSELPQLEKEARGLRVELDRLVDALAKAEGSLDVLVQAISDRQERLNQLDARIRATRAAPEAINLEVRRMEAEAKQRIGELRELLQRNQEEARPIVEMLLSDGKLVCTPVQTTEGRRFRIEGTAVLGRLLCGETPEVTKWASPTGFETGGRPAFTEDPGQSRGVGLAQPSGSREPKPANLGRLIDSRSIPPAPGEAPAGTDTGTPSRLSAKTRRDERELAAPRLTNTVVVLAEAKARRAGRG